MEEREQLRTFLGLFFEQLVPPGLIEIRLIPEKGTDSKHRAQYWSRTLDQLLGEGSLLDQCMAEAAQHNCAVYFGVMPRAVAGGKRRDLAEQGRIVWADLDFDQYEGGEADARAHLFSFPLTPSAVVRSGHGLHAYWALDNPVSVDECSHLSKRVELALRSDHVSDAPRIMRMPFTFNRKHGDAVLVELEQLADEDTYTPEEIREYTPEPPAKAERAAAAPAAPDGVTRAVAPVVPQLPPAVAEIVQASRKLTELYMGRGKQEGDLSTSGYDMSFLLALVKKGVTDAEQLASALASRPNSRAAEKGATYIHATVEKALESKPKAKAKPVPAEAEVKVTRAGEQPMLFAVDFTVEKVVIYDSDPPVYEFTIDGRSLKLSAEQLLRVSNFERRFLEVFSRMTKLPAAKDKAAWRQLVNGWLAGAERVEQPPESSREFQLREAIEDFVTDMQVGSEYLDLDRDRALLTEDGRKAFKTKTLMKALRANFRDIGSHSVTATLRGMGFASERGRWDGKQARVWIYGEPSTNGKHEPQGEDDGDVPF